jgi:hypothetical protein
MNASEDVKVLFRRFGGEANSYQEVVRERAAGVALGKWTMLGQVDLLQPQNVESVRRTVKMPAVRQTNSACVGNARTVRTGHSTYSGTITAQNTCRGNPYQSTEPAGAARSSSYQCTASPASQSRDSW